MTNAPQYNCSVMFKKPAVSLYTMFVPPHVERLEALCFLSICVSVHLCAIVYNILKSTKRIVMGFAASS